MKRRISLLVSILCTALLCIAMLYFLELRRRYARSAADAFFRPLLVSGQFEYVGETVRLGCVTPDQEVCRAPVLAVIYDCTDASGVAPVEIYVRLLWGGVLSANSAHLWKLVGVPEAERTEAMLAMKRAVPQDAFSSNSSPTRAKPSK